MIANSENQTSGGNAAQPNPINPNQTTNPNQQAALKSHDTEPSEKPVQLKQAATKFECAASSLKYNIKHGKLLAYQENAMAPYMVRLSDVERFLRVTPGVESMFYPKRKKDGLSLTGLIDKPDDKNPPSPPDPSGELQTPHVGHKKPETKPSTAHPTQTTADVSVDTAKLENQALDQKHPAGDTDSSTQAPADGTKRRRRRRRGKSGDGNRLATAELQPLVLKTLAGTTPQERLRITACLNELAGLVASA